MGVAAIVIVGVTACEPAAHVGQGADPAVTDGSVLPPPPGNPLALTVSPLVRGETATFTVEGASPGATVTLAWSGGGLGPGPCLSLLDGQCFDVPTPHILAQRVANGSGRVVLSSVVPATLPLGPVGLQAVITGTGARLSNAVLATVVDPVSPGAACLALSAPHTAPDATRLTLPYDGVDATRPGVARLGMRPIALDGVGMAMVDVQGPVELWTTNGLRLTTPWLAGDSDLPASLLVRGVAPGQGKITVTPLDPGCAAPSLEVAVQPIDGISGRTLADHPWFETAHLFFVDESVEVALDPQVFADRLGVPFDVHVTVHQDRAQWAASPRIRSMSGATTATLVPGTVADNTFTVWTGLPLPERFTDAYDVVVDFDRDGRVGPGDLLFTGTHGSVFVVRDLSEPGPYGSRTEDYNGGLWRQQRVFAPTLTASLGALDAVIISHGNGHEYTWYNYLGTHLASYGFVAMSHSSNTNPGPVSASGSLADNLAIFYARQDDWFGGALSGRLSAHQMWVGHSRGGEAVAILYNDLLAGARPSLAIDPLDVEVVASIAPTDFTGQSRANPRDVPYHLMAGGADGDVTGGPDCDICQYWRLAGYATGPVTTTYVHGAAHNDFHDSPLAWQDGVGPDRIGRARTNTFAKAYLVALAAWYLEGHDELEELFTRGYAGFHPPGIDPIVQVATTALPGDAADVAIIDDFQTNVATGLSSSGGTVTGSVADLTEGSLDDPDGNLAWNGAPMNGFTEVSGDGFERGAVFSWTSRAWLEWEIVPALADASPYTHLQLRVAQGTRHPNTTALADDLSLTVTVRDQVGHVASIDHGTASTVLPPYPRTGLGAGAGWANEFQTVRFRLSDFLASNPDLDLTALAAVRIQVGTGYGSPRGRVGLDDLELVRDLTLSTR